jgi:predicted outer membrane repeat protein
MRRWGQILLLLTLLIGVFGVQAQPPVIDSHIALVDAITNTPSGGTITLTGDIEIGDGVVVGGVTAFPTIDKTLTINGNGFMISRTATNDEFRFFHVDGSGNLTLENITLTGGRISSGNFGGAIWNEGTIQSITNSTFSANSARDWGGAIYNDGTIEAITNSTFSANTAGHGGAIDNDGTIEAITNSTFSENSAGDGGAISSVHGTIGAITNSTFSQNTATNYGGAIDNDGTIEAITNSTFSANTATDYGGAIYNDGTIEAITNSTFSQNTATNYGGAIDNDGTIEAITNSTFSENTATDYGGAISSVHGTIGAITNSTFSENTAHLEGGAIYNEGTIGAITNSVIAGTPNACYGTPTGSNNLRDGANDCADSLFLSNTINPAIHLGALADNGGPTQTIALLNPDPVINPAINAAVSGAATDQRGVPAQGVRDIGAYEYGADPTYPTVSVADDRYLESAGIVNLSITVSPHANFIGEATVLIYDTQTGTATSGVDYDAFPPQRITLTCDANTCIPNTVSLNIIDNLLLDNDRTIIFGITPANGFANVGTTPVTITIEDDDIVPTVVDVLDANGMSIDGITYTASVDELTIQFNADVFDDGTGSDPDSASNPANYILLTEGAVAGYQTADCAGGVSPDDEQISFASVSYDSSNYVTTLTFNPALSDGDYRLIICGTTSIVSAVNRALHLNNGVDVSVDFTVAIPVTPTVVPTSQPTAQAPAPQPVQPEDLGVSELPATGERPLWAELLAEWFGW